MPWKQHLALFVDAEIHSEWHLSLTETLETNKIIGLRRTLKENLETNLEWV